jgi:hypothetical protein
VHDAITAGGRDAGAEAVIVVVVVAIITLLVALDDSVAARFGNALAHPAAESLVAGFVPVAAAAHHAGRARHSGGVGIAVAFVVSGAGRIVVAPFGR